MGAVVSLEPRSVPATPGSQSIVLVRVRNSGKVVDQFAFQVLGDAAPWATIDPPTLSLFPGAEGTATIAFAPPRSPATRAGPTPFGVRVASKEDPGGSAVEEGTLEIAPFSEVSAELVPRTSRGSRGATHDLAVDNRGNVALSAAVGALDPDRLLDFEVLPPAVTADPGAAVFTKLRVKPKRTFWRGPAVGRPFQVSLDVPGGGPVVLDGSLLQTAILPPWTFRAIAAALVLVVAAFIAWQTLLKPAIESSARAQAEEVLEAVGITPPPSGGAGGASPSPSSSTGASLPPGASPTPAPSATPAPGAASPTDGRLVAGAGPLAPSAGMSLYLTDLVFSNPSDTATGELRLERSGQPLLVLQLQNFRDLDFHFVTPIVVGPGQELALICPAGCPGAALYYSGFQR
jgi:hypothetical protein